MRINITRSKKRKVLRSKKRKVLRSKKIKVESRKRKVLKSRRTRSLKRTSRKSTKRLINRVVRKKQLGKRYNIDNESSKKPVNTEEKSEEEKKKLKKEEVLKKEGTLSTKEESKLYEKIESTDKYTNLKYKLFKYVEGNQLSLYLNKGQSVYAHNSSMIYMSSDIVRRQKIDNVKKFIKRLITDEGSSVLSFKSQKDNSLLRLECAWGGSGGFEFYTINLTQDFKCILLPYNHICFATTGNVHLDIDIKFKGLLFESIDETIPRLELVSGKIGYVWMITVPYEVVKIPEGESILVEPHTILFAHMKDKSCYKIHIKTRLTQVAVFMEFKGPNLLYIPKPDKKYSVERNILEIKNKYNYLNNYIPNDSINKIVSEKISQAAQK